MRIVFDAYWWVSGPAALKHVLREIVFAWHQEFPDDSIALVVRRRHHLEAATTAPEGARLISTRFRPQALLASIVTERARRRLGYDAVVVHNFAARSRALSAVYLHDVLFVTNPEWFTRVERAYFSLMVRWVRRADVVFASSTTEAARIRTNTRARRVLPVGLGLSTELVQDSSHQAVDGLQPGSFFLTVGRLNIRKNLERTILGALESGSLSTDRPLVVVGGAGGRSEPLDPRIDEAAQAGLVRFLGHVEEAELRWLYVNTALFLFLSLGEGFGMPPLEARYFGAAVVVSDLPVMRENLPDADAFVDPTDVSAIAAAIRDFDPSGTVRDVGELSARVAAQHDWRLSVRRMRGSLVELQAT